MPLERMEIDVEYDPELYGVHQTENVDFRETLSVNTSLTNKACLRDLLKYDCFRGAAENRLDEKAENGQMKENII